jgi:bifunctional DNA primase/polymerase-like protein
VIAVDSTPLMTAALAAAERGWYVFPLRPGAKRPALHGYDRCPRTGACAIGHQGWEQRATRYYDRIRTAWSAGPFNVGLATGPSNLVVIDLDSAKPGEQPPAPWDTEDGIKDGQDVLAALAELSGQALPADTLTVATPSGGIHLYYQAPEGTALRNTAGTLGWKIDTRAHGGYVVAPGSIVDGRPYEILADQPPAPLPAWLLDRLRPAPLPAVPDRPVPVARSRRDRYVQAAINAEVARVHNATSNRNATLYVAAVALGQLAAGGTLTEEEARTALLGGAARHIGVQRFSEREALRTIDSGLRKGANRPRQVAA